MTLGKKLIVSFLGCGLIPLAVVAYMSFSTANSGMTETEEQGSTALNQNAINQLVALRDVKKGQVETYFGERQGDLGVLVETVGTLRAEAFNKLKSVQAIKRKQVEGYFAERLGDASVLSGNSVVADALASFEKAFEAEVGKAGGVQWTDEDIAGWVRAFDEIVQWGSDDQIQGVSGDTRAPTDGRAG